MITYNVRIPEFWGKFGRGQLGIMVYLGEGVMFYVGWDFETQRRNL
jgi:hypothetical protein